MEAVRRTATTPRSGQRGKPAGRWANFARLADLGARAAAGPSRWWQPAQPVGGHAVVAVCFAGHLLKFSVTNVFLLKRRGLGGELPVQV